MSSKSKATDYPYLDSAFKGDIFKITVGLFWFFLVNDHYQNKEVYLKAGKVKSFIFLIRRR